MTAPERLVRNESDRDTKEVAFAIRFGPARRVFMAPEIWLANG